MQEDKHNRFPSDEELDAVLPSTGYSIVTPLPGYAPMTAPRRLMATPITEVGGFQIQESLDAAGLAPELPTEIPGVGNLAFFKAKDAQYFSKILKEEDETKLTVEEMKECKIMRLLLMHSPLMPLCLVSHPFSHFSRLFAEVKNHGKRVTTTTSTLTHAKITFDVYKACISSHEPTCSVFTDVPSTCSS